MTIEDEKAFQILEALESEEVTTQREISDLTGIHLSQVNYVLRKLMEKGLVKIGNFRRSTNKVRYLYLLTPKGIEEKTRLAASFLITKVREYKSIRKALADKLLLLKDDSVQSIVFVGPSELGELIREIIKDLDSGIEILSMAESIGEIDEGSLERCDKILFSSNEEAASFRRSPSYTKLKGKAILFP